MKKQCHKLGAKPKLRVEYHKTIIYALLQLWKLLQLLFS